MAGGQWPIKEADLDEIILDPRNVRVRAGHGDGLPVDDPRAAEPGIVKYMVEAEDVLTLMNDILRDGYLDNEIPVVVRSDVGLTVLEGNRRLTALKLIDDPELLGSGAPRAKRLISRHPDHGTPTRIRVMLAPSWEAAQPLLARLHTGTSKKSWIREQMAIFFHAQLDGSTTVDDLRVAFPAETAKMARFIQMGEMREIIRNMKYDDPELRDFVLKSELKMTSFEYAYRPKRLQKALDLEVDRDGLLPSKRPSSGQRQALTYILERFRTGTLNTRSKELIARYEEHDEFIALIERMVAGERPKPSTDSADPETGTDRSGGQRSQDSSDDSRSVDRDSTREGGPDQPRGSAGTRAPNRGETRRRLDFNGFDYAGSSSGMRRRFEELRRLDVGDFPNATYDLLRTALECSIKDYFRAQGKALGPRVTLGPAVDALAKEFSGDPKMTGHISSIKAKGRMTAEQQAGTSVSLNLTNHEPDQFATAREVHEGWDRLKPILTEIVGSADTPTVDT